VDLNRNSSRSLWFGSNGYFSGRFGHGNRGFSDSGNRFSGSFNFYGGRSFSGGFGGGWCGIAWLRIAGVCWAWVAGIRRFGI
jgi:hypothetical protein